MQTHRRLRSVLLIGVITALAVTVGAQPAQAAPWYWYKPGHPMGPSTGQANNCTGSWAVRGQSGMFFLTAGTCQAQGTTVYGLTHPFGTVRRNDNGIMNAALVEPHAGVDALQDVVTHGEEVIGHTVGKLSNTQMPAEMFVNKMGRATGWTWGQIDGRWFNRSNGERYRCGNYDSASGDRGAPVFTRDAANRAWAAGMHVGRFNIPELGVVWSCFITIDDLLNRFGAWLPVFSATGAVSYVGPAAVTAVAPPSAPKLLVYPVE